MAALLASRSTLLSRLAACGLLARGAPAAARSVEVATLDALQGALDAVEVDEIVLTADMVGTTSDRFVYADLKGVDKVIYADFYRLPPMKIAGAVLTVSGGVIDAASAEALDNIFASLDTRTFLSEYFLRVYGDTTLILDGTVLAMPPAGDGVSALPATYIEVHSSEADLFNVGVPSDAAGSVWLTNVTTGSEPLSRALVITADEDPEPSDVAVENAFLEVTAGAVIHGVRWRDADATAPVGDGAVKLRNVWISRADDDRDPDSHLVGLTIEPSTGGRVELPFLQSGGTVEVSNARLSHLGTRGTPLIVAPTVVLNGVMADDISLVPADPTRASVVEGENISVVGSLLCELRGGGVAFHATADFDPDHGTARSVYVLNSAMWHLDQSLFSMDLPDGGDAFATDGTQSALVAANVTLHHTLEFEETSERTPVALRPSSDHGFPAGVLRNAYLQGSWQLGEAIEREGNTRILANSVVMATSESVPGPCGDTDGCVTSDTHHLHDDLVARSCSEVLDTFTEALLEPDDMGRRWLTGALVDLDPDDFPELHERPTLLEVDTAPPGIDWSAPDPELGGSWADGAVSCDASPDGEAVAIGAWSAASGTCSLPLLEPVSAEEVFEEDAEDVAEEAIFGLASSCRYGSAAAWLLLPGLWGLRRRA